MPRIVLKETTTRKIEIPMDTLLKVVDTLTDAEREKLLKKLKARDTRLKPFQKDALNAVLADFIETGKYDDGFLADLEEGLRKSSVYR